MSVEARNAPGGSAMGVGEIERELALLRLNEDGTAGARQSALNLVVPTDEDSAPEVTTVISAIASRYPHRAIVLITDPDEAEQNLEIGLSAFCSVRGGTGGQVCAEVVTVHAEGPPAEHPESFASPLLVPDLPAFLWYPDGHVPDAADNLVSLADRVIVDSGAGSDFRTSLREVEMLLDAEESPIVADLQWTALTPWRGLLARLFGTGDGGERLAGIRRVEVSHDGTNASFGRALLLVAWLSATLGWRPVSSGGDDSDWELLFSGPEGEVVARLDPGAAQTSVRRVRVYSGDLLYEIDRHPEGASARACVTRGDELLRESTVRLAPYQTGEQLGEELRFLGRDEAYEGAVRRAGELLAL